MTFLPLNKIDTFCLSRLYLIKKNVIFLTSVLSCSSNAALFTNVTFGKAATCNKQSVLLVMFAISKGLACQVLKLLLYWNSSSLFVSFVHYTETSAKRGTFTPHNEWKINIFTFSVFNPIYHEKLRRGGCKSFCKAMKIGGSKHFLKHYTDLWLFLFQ